METGTHQDTQYGMSRLLRETFDLREGTPGSILQRLLNAARLYLGMDISFISRFEDGYRVFERVDEGQGMNVLKAGDSDPLEETYCQRVVDGRLPELICDAQTIDEARKIPVTEELGIGAHVSIPIRLGDGSVFGTFCCFKFEAEHSLNERDISLIREFADIAADLLETNVYQARDEEARIDRIRGLLDQDRFHMVWQPITEIRTGEIAGVEALARFPSSPHKGPPGWFQDAASINLGDDLESRCVAKALAILKELPDNCYVACNTSARAVLQGRIQPLLEHLPPSRIVLEITEHDAVSDYADLIDILGDMRRDGLRLAVDDAGAGYASFRHIIKLRPDLIKLDMSLTRDIDTDISRRSLAYALVRFAREIDSRIIAEGVETKPELETLESLGVEMAQGFYLHRPKPLDDLRQILRRVENA